MGHTLRELADLVQGELVGDPNLEISGANTLEEAEPGDITFVEDLKHATLLQKSRASAALVPLNLAPSNLPCIKVADPLLAFITVTLRFHGRPLCTRTGVDARAAIHPTVLLGSDTTVYPFAHIDEGVVTGKRCRIHSGVSVGRFCRLGDDVVLHANVVLYDGTIIGDRTTVHANSVLGADGFGYRPRNGRHLKVPQVGTVEIGADCEIGSCSTIDRGTFRATTVGEGTKIDNLVQIAHNCRIGNHNLFVSQTGIAGSSRTGDYVVVAGQAGIVDHVRIGDRVIIGAQAGVTKDVPSDQRVLGSPATPVLDQKRIMMSLEKLPEIRKDLGEIKRRLGLDGDHGARDSDAA